MRAVTGDHVMFNECIPMFRPENLNPKDEQDQKIGYLLLDFSLQEPIDLIYFSIQPTIEIRLPGAYAAFIAPVFLPKWFELDHNLHLFTIALSSVFSFVTGRPIKATRDDYLYRREVLDESSMLELAVQHPVLTAGPGSHDTRLSEEYFQKLRTEIQETVRLLFDLPYGLYKTIMQSIRLVHLAHLNKRDDFGLGYYLLISSMEPVARDAIRRKDVAPKHHALEEWKEIAKSNPEFERLLSTYQQEVGKNKYIGKRFEEFVMRYCPPDQWLELEHPRENSIKYSSELTGDNHNWEWITKKQWYEIYPEDLTEKEIRKLIFDAYTHRSKYTHEGENPPHRSPDSNNRFFDKETVVDYDEKTEQFRGIHEIVLPNFRLIAFIARKSILNYLIKKAGEI